MPPVFGPCVAVVPALGVLRGQQRDDGRAVGDGEQRHLRAVEVLLDQHRVARVEHRRARGRARRPGRSVTSTPLPAASPSSFTTHGGPASSAATSSSAVASSAAPPTGHDARRGHAGGGHHVLGEGLAALQLGGLRRRAEAGDARPRGRRRPRRRPAAPPARRRRGRRPSRRPARRPRPGRRRRPASGSATARVPALPGAQASASTAGSEDRATHRACSRAPEPMTSTRTDADPIHPPPGASRRAGARRRPATV